LIWRVNVRHHRRRWRASATGVAVTVTCAWMVLAGCGGALGQVVTGGVAGTSQQKDIEDNLQLLTGNNEAAARKIGAARLIGIGTPEATAALVEVLSKPANVEACLAVAAAAAESDGEIPALVEPLIALLDSEDPKLAAAAGTALGSYKNHGVAARLGTLSRDPESPLRQRLAAITALSGISERRAIDALVTLLDDRNPEIRTRVLAGLRRAALVDFGQDIAAWKRWWQLNKSKKPVEWLHELNEVLTRQNRDLVNQLGALRTRLLATLRTNYQKTADAGKQAVVLSYLRDALPEVRLLGIDLVNTLITDRKKIEADVMAQLRQLVADPSPKVRSEVVTILRDAGDKQDAARILAQLQEETDSQVKEAMLNALGRLGDPAAVPALVEALDDPSDRVVATAAAGLGLLGQKGKISPAAIAPAVKPLIQRFERLDPEDASLRDRFLGAMARIADPAFRATFVKNLELRNTSSVRQAAIRGIAALDDPTLGDQLVPALTDSDAGVRQAAAEALGRIGKADAHLQALLERLDPRTEATEIVRQAAWSAFRRILAGRTPAEQQRWVGRLGAPTSREAAAQFVDLATEVEQALAAETPTPAGLAALSERIADALMVLDRFGEAAGRYRRLYDALVAGKDPRANEVGLKLLRAELAGSQPAEGVARCRSLMDGSTDRALAAQVGRVLLEQIQAHLTAKDPERAVELTAAVSATPLPRQLGATWLTQFDDLRRQAEQARRQADAAVVAAGVAAQAGNSVEAKRARDRIIALGPRAVGPLAEQLRQIIETGRTNGKVEQAIVEMLQAVKKDWTPYPPNADKTTKLKAITALLG